MGTSTVVVVTEIKTGRVVVPGDTVVSGGGQLGVFEGLRPSWHPDLPQVRVAHDGLDAPWLHHAFVWGLNVAQGDVR